MYYTNATVIIAAADQSAAQADFPGSFTSGFADPSGAVFYVCSGLWADDDLARITDDDLARITDDDLARITDGPVAWPSQVYHDEVGAVLERLGLNSIPPPDSSQPA